MSWKTDYNGLVSIHSLTQRETCENGTSQADVLFQSTPSRRGRREPCGITRILRMFQSTPSRRGRRLLPMPMIFRLLSFNPLPHAEGDRDGLPSPSPGNVSIHSLTQRETKFARHTPRSLQVSIHSLTQRETLMEKSERLTDCRFNPLPHAEGDD